MKLLKKKKMLEQLEMKEDELESDIEESEGLKCPNCGCMVKEEE